MLGGTGFLGSHVVELLLSEGARVRVATRSLTRQPRASGPHRDRVEFVEADCANVAGARAAARGSEIVIHMAGEVAGIEKNRSRPATMFAENARLLLPVFDACVAERVPRVVYVSSACVYGDQVRLPTPEDDGFVGDPEETNLGYGWAKRMGEVIARLYAKEHGLSVAILRPYNAYGPRDHFEPQVSHVIPSLIRRVHEEAGDLVVWGSGRPTRSFVYCDDVARGVLALADVVPNGMPINIGSDEEVTIDHLAHLIIETSRVRKRVVFDTSRPDGQLRRHPDLRRARALGFTALTTLQDGLDRTISWFQATLAGSRSR